MVGLALYNDPESNAGRSAATARASHARQVKGDDPDKKIYPGPPSWGFGMKLKTYPIKNIVTKHKKRGDQGPTQGCRADDDDDDVDGRCTAVV